MEETISGTSVSGRETIQKSRPDWKNPEEYSYLKNANVEQLAWEFLRRNKCYQSDYKKYKHYNSSKALKLDENTRSDKEFLRKYFKCNPSSKKHESYDEYQNRMRDEGYSLENGEVRIVSKRIAFYRKYDLKPHSNMKRYSPRNQKGPGFSFLNEKYPMFIKHDELGSPGDLKETFNDQVVVKLCVLLPLDEQLAAVKNEMRIRAEKIGKKSFKEKGLSDVARSNYIICLRVLDAIKKEASDHEIQFYIYKHTFPYPASIRNLDQLIEAYKSLDPGSQKTITKRLTDDKNQADALCNKGTYVSIIKSRSHYLNQSERKSKNRIAKEI